jgi:hypothetical protein
MTMTFGIVFLVDVTSARGCVSPFFRTLAFLQIVSAIGTGTSGNNVKSTKT